MIEVTVQDQGLGMSKSEKEMVFEPYQRTKNKESSMLNRNGNGVGLSICKRIC